MILGLLAVSYTGKCPKCGVLFKWLDTYPPENGVLCPACPGDVVGVINFEEREE